MSIILSIFYHLRTGDKIFSGIQIVIINARPIQFPLSLNTGESETISGGWEDCSNLREDYQAKRRKGFHITVIAFTSSVFFFFLRKDRN